LCNAALRDAFFSSLRSGPQVMGVLNVTPDSFSDGGRHADPETAAVVARDMIAAGAAIVDVGGESTRPGSTPVNEEEELSRVLPALERLSEARLPLSIDTTKAAVATKAAALGAILVNDVWGLQKDPRMAETIAQSQVGLVVMHNREKADPSLDILDDLKRFFDRSLALAAGAGIPQSRILIDPGIGFGKTLEQNLTCLWRLDALKPYRLPILVGVSRKSFIGRILDAPVDRRLIGTLAAGMVALMRGASVLRVHDVSEHVEIVKMFGAMKGAGIG